MVPLEDGRLLRMLAESTGAKNVVEIGTYNGYSTLWFCLALRTTGGKITTHEISAKNIALARQNFKKAGVENLVTIVEGDAHETVDQASRSRSTSCSSMPTSQAMPTTSRSCCRSFGLAS